jgi:hypothetical protein
MPGLVPEALQCYQAVWPERLKQFPPDPKAYVIKKTDGEDIKWYHQLRHDVESTFWIFLYWAIHLRPDNTELATEIPVEDWAMLTSTKRGGLIPDISDQMGRAWVDPAYAPLQELLCELASHLTADLHWVNEDHPLQMADPSYLREVFQRCILNFLFKNRGQPFMCQKRHRVNRKFEKFIYTSSGLINEQVKARQTPGSGQTPGSRPSLKRARNCEDEAGRDEWTDERTRKRSKRNSVAGSEGAPDSDWG